MVHVHGAVLGAAMQRRHRLAGIEQVLGVEGVLDFMELTEFVGAELHAHLIQFFDTDTVLTGDGASRIEAQL